VFAEARVYFQSPTFLFLFLPAVLGGYHLAQLSLRGGRVRHEVQNLFLFAASVFFYAWGEQFRVGLLLGSWAVNYLLALFAERHPRAGSVVAVVANLALLGWLKYAGFVATALGGVWPSVGELAPSLPQVEHLPLGVSFFTFQAISYVLDVAGGKLPADRHPIRYGVFVFLFPHLIAGPIVRYADLAGQLRTRPVGVERFAAGVRRFVIGLAKKLLLANTFAVVADDVFATAPHHLGASAAWLGVACYALQISFDFGGYSDMAIGLGKMFGFDFAENFRHPYSAASVTDFWRRWHISLSSWFRDYLYIPLGGSRAGPVRTYLNLLLVFALCGLWHGANWTFLAWGLWHGGFLVVERLGLGAVLAKAWPPLRHAFTLLAVLVGWVFFRATSLAHAAGVLAAMAGLSGGGEKVADDLWKPRLLVALPVGVLACLPVLPWAVRVRDRLAERWGTLGGSAVEAGVGLANVLAVGVLLVAVGTQVVAGTHSPFIYFRF
jgi:alginate O-acetyltransferase complex protein AlgI